MLFCFDGSDGSRGALRAAADLIDRPADAVVLTVWETIETQMALAGAFAAGAVGRRTWMPVRRLPPSQWRKREHCGRTSTDTRPRR